MLLANHYKLSIKFVGSWSWHCRVFHSRPLSYLKHWHYTVCILFTILGPSKGNQNKIYWKFKECKLTRAALILCALRVSQCTILTHVCDMKGRSDWDTVRAGAKDGEAWRQNIIALSPGMMSADDVMWRLCKYTTSGVIHVRVQEYTKSPILQ